MSNADKLLKIGIKKRNKEINKSWNDLALEYSDGMFQDGESYRLWVKNRLRRSSGPQNHIGESGSQKTFKNTVEINKDGTQTSSRIVRLTKEDKQNPRSLLKAHDYDPDEWNLVKSKITDWEIDSKRGRLLNYASTIIVEPKKDGISYEQIKDIFLELDRTYKKPIHKPTKYSPDGKMLEVNVTDLHLGKLGSSDANDVYNHYIARDRFFKIINDIIYRTKSYQFEKILFVWSHDFFHIDNSIGTTTAGTRQDVTLRFSELFKMGVQMLTEAIDLLSEVAPVHTCYVGANHDKLMSYFATEYLFAWYRNDPNVTVDADPKIRKYIEFGKVLLGLTHGHAEGKRIKHLMPIEVPEAWGRTVYREFHRGHIHSEKAEIVEENGIIIRNLGSPSGNDAWHYESGYVGSIRKSQNFIWDKENGLEEILYITF